MDVAQLLDQARRCEEEGRIDDALSAWLGLSRLVPDSLEVYERLFALHVHRREVDAAFCAASVLVALDAPDGMARELYEDYRPRRLPARRPDLRLDADDWALLRHPLEKSATTARLVAENAREPAHALDQQTFAWAAALLGASTKDLPSDDAPSLDGRPDLDDVWHNHALRERLFFAGRAAAALCTPAHATLTRDRAGLLVGGEPHVAYQLLVREEAGPVLRGHLLSFAVSPVHHRLRKKLGIAVGITADAPTSESPLPRPKGRAPTADVILRALLEPERPPATVSDLTDALEIEIEAGMDGTIVLPGGAVPGPFFAVRHVEGRVVAFWVRCSLTDEMEAVLRAKGFEGARFTGAQGEVYRTFGPWVATTQSGCLGWFATVPDWLSMPIDWKERDAMLSALGKAIRETDGVAELQDRVARLAPMVVVSHVDARGIYVRFVPSIPTNVFNRAYVWANRRASSDAEGWVLVDDEKPGPWMMLPRLADHPTGGLFDDARHAPGVLDVVASMRISLTAAAPASLHPPALVAMMDAILLAPTLPRTVRDLERAFGFMLTEAHFASSSSRGSLSLRDGLPPPLTSITFRWRGETRPRSLDALRGRALKSGWSIQVATGRAYFAERLRAAYGTPKDLPNGLEVRVPNGRFVLSDIGHEDGGNLALAVIAQNTLPT